MAFIVALVLSLSLIVQVETVSSSTALAQLRAKESAKLALFMALGDLQKYAGPDQRVTARAEILGTAQPDETPFWTGVWDTANPFAGPRWLVSWQNQIGSPGSKMQLVGEGTAGSDITQHVVAPKIDVLGSSGAPSAEIAWWISDEGVKASAGTLPLNLRKEPNFLPTESVEGLELQIANTHGLEELFGEYDRFAPEDKEEALALVKIDSIEQLLSIGDFADEASRDFSGEAPFHALAPGSFGVLASTIDDPDAGLMRDLSLFPQLLDSGVEEYLKLGEKHAEELSAGSGVDALRLFTEMQGLDAIGTLNDGDVYTPITPVLSNFLIGFSIRSDSASDPNLYLRMRCFFELWNPYTHSLSMKDSLGNDLDIELEILGLPNVTVTKRSGIDESSTTFSLQDVVADLSEPEGPLVITLRNNVNEEWIPGRSKNWVGVAAGETSTGSPYESIVTDSKRFDLNSRTLGGRRGIDTGADLSGTGDLSVSSDPSGSITSLTVRVYLKNTVSNTRSLLSELQGIEYDPIATLPRTYTNRGIHFGYHFILRGPHQSLADPEYYRGLWLSNHDPRNLTPQFNAAWNLPDDPSGSSGSAYLPIRSGITPLAVKSPEEIADGGRIRIVAFQRLHDRSDGTDSFYDVLWQDAPLFELPRDRVLSLASLQHMYFHKRRPFAVGNSWGLGDFGSDKNTLAWFDRYYFTGFSRDDDANIYDSTLALPNPALVSYDFENPITQLIGWQSGSGSDRDAAREPAESFLVSNRFNINSTSVAAWKTALGSLRLDDWSYLNYPEEDTSDLSSLSVANADREGTFARFSQSLEETYEAPNTPATANQGGSLVPVAPSAYYRHGARRFDHSELKALATEIVQLLENRGRPFSSMEEFLSPKIPGDPSSPTNPSLLEEAIANVLGTGPGGRQQWYHQWETEGIAKSTSGESPIEIDHFSPGFLTQADILTAIGPMVSTRSDTFKVRARGESISLQGEVEGAATIEATFQRTPEPVDPTVDPADATDRQFRLLAIRWLEEDEI